MRHTPKTLVVTTLQNDKMCFYYDEFPFTPQHLRTCLSALCGIPKDCISFYKLEEEKSIDRPNITAIFTPKEEHILLRIKLNRLLSTGQIYNTTYFCQTHLDTSMVDLVDDIKNIVIKKFEIASFAVGINRKTIYDTNINSPEIYKAETLQNILQDKKDLKIVDVIIKESYHSLISR